MYSIIRKQSHRKTAITAVHNHNMRIVVEENVNTNKTPLNKILIGSENTREDILGYIKTNDVKIRNRETIVFNEFILTASPEFFFNNPDGSKKSKKEYRSNLNEWIKTQMDYLAKEKYGKCVNAVLHMDESTPHIHAIILPIKENKLNNKAFWRGKNSYSRMIDDYAKDNAKHGLKRGEPISDTLVNHTTLKDYRNLIRSDRDEEKLFYEELDKNILEIPAKKNFVGMEKKYSLDEVKAIASTTFQKLNRQRRRAKFREKKSQEKTDVATSQFYKQRNKASMIELRKTEITNEFEDYKRATSHVSTENNALKSDLSDFELMKRVLPEELQALVKRARDLDSGGSGATELTPEPKADIAFKKTTLKPT